MPAIAIIFVLSSLTVYLTLTYILAVNPVIPFVPNEIFVALIFIVFAAHVVMQLVPSLAYYRDEKVKSVLISVLFIPIVILAFAHLYNPQYYTSSTYDYNELSSLYFSVVTFTTLGYGDFNPTEAGRPYAMLEALSGFLFIPLLFSQLIQMSQSAHEEFEVHRKNQKRISEIAREQENI